MVRTIIESKFTYWILFLYALVLSWWIYLQYTEHATAYYFYAFYGVIGLSGAIYGIRLAFKKWGGFQSVIGRGLIFLAIGLLGQWFGLQVWTYYNVILQVEIPYPSLADVGYFALIPAYTYAALMFAKAAGANFSLRTKRGKLQALIIPAIALAGAYYLFLKNIGVDPDPLKTFLDYGYPLGEIIPVSIALLTFTLSRNLLGGVMRSKIMFLMFAFFFQFLTEYTFLYIVGADLFVDGGPVDLMYATSYAIMSLALVAFSRYE